MNSKEFIQALEDGKTVFRTDAADTLDQFRLRFEKTGSGKIAYNDCDRGVVVIFDRLVEYSEDEVRCTDNNGIPMGHIFTKEWTA